MQNWSKNGRKSKIRELAATVDWIIKNQEKLAAIVDCVLGAVDWIEPVDRMLRPEANMSTG